MAIEKITVWQCCLAVSSKTAPGILIFFQLPWVPNLHFS
jgi:hypothetical protein